MGLTHFPNGLSSFGVPVIGGGSLVPFSTGTYYFVDSATGNNANDGLDPDHPVATIDYAVGLSTANKGDVIIVMPNHAENIAAAAGLDLDKEGITVVGLGSGNNRPALTFSGASLCDIDVDADSVTVKNIYFDLSGSTSAAKAFAAAIDVNDNHFTLESCEFKTHKATGGAVCVLLADSNAVGMKILNNRFLGNTATTCPDEIQNVINLNGEDLSDVEIAGNVFDCQAADAHIYSLACSMEMIHIHHNTFHTGLASTDTQYCVFLGNTAAANYGVLAYNTFRTYLFVTAEAAGKGNIGKLAPYENYYASVSGVGSGYLIPDVQSAAS